MITNKSNFEGAAKSLTSRYAELSRKSEEALVLFQQEQYEEAYETMLDLARKSERATLISRKLPTHTGTFLLGRGTSGQSCVSGTPGLGLPNINTQAGHAGLICQGGNRVRSVSFLLHPPLH